MSAARRAAPAPTRRRSKSTLLTVDIYPDGDGAPYAMDLTSQDFGRWERKYGEGRSYKNLIATMQASWLEEVAHVAAKRRGRFDAGLEAFCDQHAVMPAPDADFLEFGGVDDREGPTQPDR